MPMPDDASALPPRKTKIHRRLSVLLQLVLIAGVAGELWAGQWFAAATTSAIVLLTFLPLVLARRFRFFIPPEFALLAIVFVFASLYLGEVRDYYTRFWWWDIALHTASGMLLGIIGFLLVHALNQMKHVEVHLKPGFVACFAFMFAVGVGALWEIFEFTMDQLVGTTMQKPMLGDPSGLTDTMWDLIVDTLGAVVISVLGYGYIKVAGNTSFLERWIDAFIEANPRLFRKRD